MFRYGNYTLSSGAQTRFKIECDDLNQNDYEALAYLVSKRYRFKSVRGIPTGGNKFAAALMDHIDDGARLNLIVDDVYTTGDSFKAFRNQNFMREDNVQGITIFSRSIITLDWVVPIFTTYWDV